MISSGHLLKILTSSYRVQWTCNLKLVNDGYALALGDLEHPDWAQWRESLFAFSTEPATIVINREAFEGVPTPSSRQGLDKSTSPKA